MGISASACSWSLPREKTLTPDECTRILAHASDTNPRLYVFLAVSANTALRVCEILHLKAEDALDGQLRIVRRKKKNLKPELIDVNPDLWAILVEWKQMYNEGWLFPGRSKPCTIKRSSGSVETICEGGHLAKRHIQEWWDQTLSHVGLKMRGRGIHSLRHYGITRFYSAYRDLRAAQLFAGHASSSMTEKYAKIVDMKEKVHGMPASL